VLDAPQHRQQFGFFDRLTTRLAGGSAQILDRLAEVAVRLDGIHDEFGDQPIAIAEGGQVQLPLQVILQRFGLARHGGEVARVVFIAAAGAGAGAEIHEGVLPVAVDAKLLRNLVVGAELQRAIRLFRHDGWGRDFLRRDLRGVVLGFKEGIGVERLADFRLQVERRQLQQPDGLLQLRRQGEVLRDAEFETCLHAASGLAAGLAKSVPQPAPVA